MAESNATTKYQFSESYNILRRWSQNFLFTIYLLSDALIFFPINAKYVLSFVCRGVRFLAIDLRMAPLTALYLEMLQIKRYKETAKSAYFFTSFNDWVKLNFSP